MKMFALVLRALLVLIALYYLTAIVHVIYPIFGKGVDINKVFIPFYGWVKGWKSMK